MHPPQARGLSAGVNADAEAATVLPAIAGGARRGALDGMQTRVLVCAERRIRERGDKRARLGAIPAQGPFCLLSASGRALIIPWFRRVYVRRVGRTNNERGWSQ